MLTTSDVLHILICVVFYFSNVFSLRYIIRYKLYFRDFHHQLSRDLTSLTQSCWVVSDSWIESRSTLMLNKP